LCHNSEELVLHANYMAAQDRSIPGFLDLLLGLVELQGGKSLAEDLPGPGQRPEPFSHLVKLILYQSALPSSERLPDL